MNRRTYLERAGAAAGAAALAGCIGDGTDAADDEPGAATGEAAIPELPEVEDPPEAVYVPTHREAMRMVEPIEAGDYVVAPMLSYPHPFWIVTDEEVSREDPEPGPGVHLMLTAWDAETGVVLPVDSGAEIRVERDGELVGSPRAPWTMISQEMGFHVGDNVTLDGDGTYAVEVTLPPLSVRLSGDLDGKFEETETATFEFTYDEAFREETVGGVEYLDEELWGERGALEPMDHEHDDHDHDDHDDHVHDDDDDDHVHDDDDDHVHDDDDHDHDHDHDHDAVPYSALPDPEAYPGTLFAEPAAFAHDGDRSEFESGDATFVVALLEPGSRFVDDDERYLLVSPRTPYNAVPLADMTLEATVERDGAVVEEADVVQTIDGEYDHHYGAALADVQPGDDVTIEVVGPPQVARHRGYETAFLEMPPIETSVPE